MGSDVIFDNLYLDKCLRSGWYLDIVMLILLGVVSLMFRFDSVVFGLPGSCIWWWMICCHLIFWSITCSMSYWGIFPFWVRFTNFHGVTCSSPLLRIMHLMMDDLMSPEFFSIYHTSMLYWGIFLFWLRVIDFHGATWLFSLTRCAPRRWHVCYLVMISQWSLFGAI